MSNFINEVRYRITRNPVLVGAAALWAFEALNTGDPITWRSALAVAVGVLVRSKVVPVSETAEVTDFLRDLTDRIDDAAAEAERF